MFYAEFDVNNVCTGISMLKGQVDMPNMIEISSMDMDYLWRKYEDGQWSEKKYHYDENGNLVED